MHIRMYVYVYVCMIVWMYVCVYVCLYEYMNKQKQSLRTKPADNKATYQSLQGKFDLRKLFRF